MNFDYDGSDEATVWYFEEATTGQYALDSSKTYMSNINLRFNKVELQDSLLLAADKTTEETFYDYEPQYS